MSDAGLDLTQFSIEELMHIEVVSVARKEQTIFEAAAAVFVITGEDMRRAGVTSIPEALRMVPGVQAGRQDANKWAVTARGFNDVFANKLLVLIDGRSVYTPVFSGVFWDVQDLVLEDVERIEVIRGPGGTLWGANAVNGVINILTKEARDTQGGLVHLGGGTDEEAFATARYGGSLSERAYYRVHAKYFQRAASKGTAGLDLEDDWYLGRVGGRLDWELDSGDVLTLQGSVYDGQVGQTVQLTTGLEPPYVETFPDDWTIDGGHVLAGWRRVLDEDADLELQVYYDHTERRGTPIGGQTETFDMDFQHRFRPSRRQEIVWGLNTRTLRDDFSGSFTITFDPPNRTTHLFSVFAQDEVAFRQDRLHLIGGAKLERNSYTGFELQPNVRLVWMPSPDRTLWGAVSRAVRTPSRNEVDQIANVQIVPPDENFEGSPLIVARVVGNRDFESENLLAFDMGYRTRLGESIALDLAGFYNFYNDLHTSEPGTVFAEGEAGAEHVVLPLLVDNKLHGTTRGVEVAANWQVRPKWQLRGAYTYLHMDMELDADGRDPLATTWDVENPKHWVSLRSAVDLTRRIGLDLHLRYMDELPVLEIDRYLTLDARLGWRASERLEVFVVGQHLLTSPHMEFTRQNVVNLTGEVRAGLYGGLNFYL